MIVMNRYAAKDLEMRKDNKDSINTFHSQGTIIGTGASNILARDGIKLNENQLMLAVGPAVSKDYWNKTSKKIINEKITIDENGKLQSNIRYEANGNDPVRPTADSNNIADLTWNSLLNGFIGSVIRNKNEHQIKAYYKHIPNYDQYYNQDRSENEKNDVGK